MMQHADGITDVLGIDAGGSKTQAAFESLAALSGADPAAGLQFADFGPGNFRQIGLEGIRSLCRRIREHFELSPAGTAVVAGFAGAGTPESWNSIREVFQDQGFPPQNTTITSDAELMLRSLGDGGVLLIAGTGSICIGRRAAAAINDDSLVRAGGYGYRIQSEASGYYLGMRAIDAALKLEDGRRQEPTVLAQVVKEHFQLVDLTGRISHILYPRGLDIESTQEKVAQLAPLVLAAAAQGDQVAQGFVNDAVTELADHVRAVLKRLDLNSSVVGLHGGLFKFDLADGLLIKPIAEHEYLREFDLDFRTVGVKPADPNPLLQVMQAVFCQSQR